MLSLAPTHFSTSILTKDPCVYFFKKKAESIFDTNMYKPAEVNHFLDLLHTRALHFFERKAFFLFDPMTRNDQCHFYALRLHMLFHNQAALSLTEEEHRFITLSFIITSCFSRNKGLLTDLVTQGNKEMNKKKFNSFINHQMLLENTQSILIEETHQFTVSLIRQIGIIDRNPSPLTEELNQIAADRSILISPKSNLLTFPKFAGTMLMTQLIQHNLFTIVAIKVKVQCDQGFHIKTFILKTNGDKLERKELAHLTTTPVVVIEGFAIPGQNAQVFFNTRSECPQGLFSGSKTHKGGKTSCLACTPCPKKFACFTLRKHQIKLNLMSTVIKEILLSEGAKFTYALQSDFFTKYFSTEARAYPHMHALFDEVVKLRGAPLTIEHVYADNGLSAISASRLLDSRPEQIIKDRGII